MEKKDSDRLKIKIAEGVEGPLDQEIEILDPKTYPHYVSIGKFNIDLPVPLYNQCDTSWRNVIMQTCGYTICSAGCALTSTAMVFKYFGAINKNPQQLNSCLGSKACPIYWKIASDNCNECWENLHGAYFVDKYGYSLSLLASALNNGRPPILELKKNTLTHWVVVRKVDGDGTSLSHYTINDPNGGVVRPLTDYTNNGWSGNSIVIYKLIWCA